MDKLEEFLEIEIFGFVKTDPDPAKECVVMCKAPSVGRITR